MSTGWHDKSGRTQNRTHSEKSVICQQCWKDSSWRQVAFLQYTFRLHRVGPSHSFDMIIYSPYEFWITLILHSPINIQKEEGRLTICFKGLCCFVQERCCLIITTESRSREDARGNRFHRCRILLENGLHNSRTLKCWAAGIRDTDKTTSTAALTSETYTICLEPFTWRTLVLPYSHDLEFLCAH